MKTVSIVLLVTGILNCTAQTNSPPIPGDWLSLPRTQLREPVANDAAKPRLPTDASEVPDAPPAPASPNEPETPDNQTTSNPGLSLEHRLTSSLESDDTLLRRIEAQGGLIRKQPESENYFVRSFNTMFDTAPMRVGKTTTVTCSLVTAIKKKNPLCLINPYVLVISW